MKKIICIISALLLLCIISAVLISQGRDASYDEYDSNDDFAEFDRYVVDYSNEVITEDNFQDIVLNCIKYGPNNIPSADVLKDTFDIELRPDAEVVSYSWELRELTVIDDNTVIKYAFTVSPELVLENLFVVE